MIEPITTARPQSLLMRRQGASEGGALAAPAATAAPAPSAAQPARTAQAAATTQSAMQPARAAQAATTAPAATTAHAAQPPRVSGGDASGALSAMRTAQEVMQAVGTAAPSAENSRIANEAYQMEARAQSDLQRGRAAAGGGTREWTA